MTKMDALWAYQEAELEKAQIEGKIRTTPARMQLNKLHKQLKAQQTAIAKLTEDMEAYELQLQKLTEQAARLEDRLSMETAELETMQKDEESTAEEMTELKGDVERLNREMNQCLRETKALLDEIERAAASYHETRQNAGKAKKEYDALRVVCETERSEHAAELQKCDEGLADLAHAVDPALMKRYTQVKLHHAAPIARVVSSKCGGCNMSLPMVMLKKIATTDGIVECENCGRILYSQKA